MRNGEYNSSNHEVSDDDWSEFLRDASDKTTRDAERRAAVQRLQASVDAVIAQHPEAMLMVDGYLCVQPARVTTYENHSIQAYEDQHGYRSSEAQLHEEVAAALVQHGAIVSSVLLHNGAMEFLERPLTHDDYEKIQSSKATIMGRLMFQGHQGYDTPLVRFLNDALTGEEVPEHELETATFNAMLETTEHAVMNEQLERARAAAREAAGFDDTFLATHPTGDLQLVMAYAGAHTPADEEAALHDVARQLDITPEQARQYVTAFNALSRGVKN